jgi:hypothetical protein
MSKGSSQATTQTVTQDVPEWAQPYYTDLLEKSKALSEEAYVPYEGQRVTEDSADLTASEQMIRDLAGNPIAGVDDAMSTYGSLQGQAAQLGQQQPSQFTASKFTATQVNPYTGFSATQVSPYAGFNAGQASAYGGFSEYGGASAYGYQQPGTFTAQTVDQYMNPYTQLVVQQQQDDAFEEYLRSQGSRDAQAVAAGAFGGSRSAVQEGMAQEELSRQMADIQARGAQQAYTDAQRMFESDRGAQMTVEQQRAAEQARVQGMGQSEAARVQQAQAAEQARVQGTNISEQARVQQAQAAELARTQGISVEEAARIQAAQAAEQARVQGISVDEAARVQAGTAAEQARVQQATADEAMKQRQFELETMGFSADMASQMAALGMSTQQADIQEAQLLASQGLSSMSRDQAELDMAYEDWLRQQGYPEEQLAMYSSMLYGLPVQAAGTTTYTEPYNPYQQALGAGISALGLYNGMQPA